MQQFFADGQESEAIAAYASRLETTLAKVVKLGHLDNTATDSMLKSKFWTGLKSQQIRNATRHKYDKCDDFQSLLREVRQVEQEELNVVKSTTTKPKSAQQHSTSANSDHDKFSNENIYKQLCDLKSHLESLEKKMASVKTEPARDSYQPARDSYQPARDSYPVPHGGYGRGRGGNYRGRGPRNFRRGGNRGFRGHQPDNSPSDPQNFDRGSVENQKNSPKV